MKTQSVALVAHRDLRTTTLAWCWKVSRRDGQIFGFTSLDRTIVINGLQYEGASGFTPTAVQGSADLSVQNMDTTGFLDSDSITEADLLAGLWDGATIEVFEVNYKDLTAGQMYLAGGTIGNVKAGRNAFTCEVRGLTQKVQQPVGRVYAPSCAADLGDTECKVNLPALSVAGSVTSVTGRRNFSDSTKAQAADYFGAGVVTWTSGLNNTLRMEVQSFTAGAFELVLPMPYPVALSDTFTVVPGCRKRRTEDCKNKYSNVINFRGVPDLPLNDRTVGNAGL